MFRTLRERREDIPALVQHFAKLTGEEHNLKPKRFDPRAMEALQRYRWRGNIRELRNTVERVMIMAPGDLIRVEDLPAEIRGDSPARPMASEPAAPAQPAAASAGPSTGPTAAPGTLREFKEAAERAFLVDKLRENNWNISKTAEALDANGWFRTGDVGVIGRDGYLRLVGRIKDMIRVGGENVAAADVEAILLKHDAVKQAVAVGMADDRLVEVVAVFVELKTGKRVTEQEIVDYCRQHLASFKVPRRVGFVSDWPITGAGKIQRFVLKNSLARDH